MSRKLRILIVDDDRRMARTLVDILNVKGYEAEAVHCGSEALHKIEATLKQAEHRFHCVVTDIKMPQMSGVDLYRAIRAIQPELPVVFMTAYAADEQVEEALAKGAIAILPKPLNINLLLSFLSALSKEPTVVIVDDDPQFGKTLGNLLQTRDFPVIQVTDPFALMGKLKPNGQVVILDMKLKETTGLEVLKQIRKKYPRLPVVLVTGYRDEMGSSIEAALALKAFTCLYKPFEIENLVKALREVWHQELGRMIDLPV